MNGMRLGAGLAALLTLASGCEDGREPLPQATDGPWALGDALLYVGHDRDESPWAAVVDVARREPKVERIELGEGSVAVAERPGQSVPELLVLSSGKPAELVDGEPRDLVNAQLGVFDRSGEKRRYALAGRFGELSVSDDGRFAIAFAPPAGEFAAENALSVVDLTRPPSDAGAARTVLLAATSGEVPESFVFAPPGSPRPLALLRLQNRVMILDLAHPTADQIDAPVSLPSDDAGARPNAVVFSGDRIFVQADGSSFVLVLSLIDDPSEERGFSVTPGQISVASPVRDIALTGAGEAARLLVLARDEVAVFEREGVPTASLPIGGAFQHLLPFSGRSPFDGEVRQRALLYGEGEARLGFLDVDAGDVLVGQDVELVDLVEPVETLVPIAERQLVVATHASGRLSLVDLEERTVSPISTGDPPSETLLDATRARLWVTTTGGSVGSIDLVTLAGAQILLEPYTEDMRLVPGARPRVALIHPSSAGHVTLLDAARPTREGALELVGFLWSGLFD